jgi:hypothetical protein
MHSYDRDEKYERLRRRLRREARQARPAFSDDLHARLMSAVVQRPFVAGRGSARQRKLAYMTFAAAASIAAAVALAWLWRTPQAAKDGLIVRSVPATNTAGAVHGAASAPLPHSVPRDGAASDLAAGDIDSMAEDFARSASGIGAWALSVADDSQWAGLDRDAQSALAAVAGPLPFDLTFSLAEE